MGALTRGRWLLIGAVMAVLVITALTPNAINAYRNGQGIAWTVADDEDLVVAQGGLAVTKGEEEPVLFGRDARTGERKWRLRMPGEPGAVRVWRIGPLLLTDGFDGRLRALEAGSGKVRWVAGEVRFVGVTDGASVAVTRCRNDCEVASLSLADGRVRWTAPVEGAAQYLGVPLPDEGAPQRAIPPWRASFVVLRDEQGFQARDLATGRTLVEGPDDDLTTMLGDVLVRAADDGTFTATDLRRGAQLWSREGRPSIIPLVSAETLALPEGRLVLSVDGFTTDTARLGDTLRLIDPRTGEERAYPLALESGLVDVLGAERPGAQPPVVVATDFESEDRDTKVVAGSHTFGGNHIGEVHVTTGLVGFESAAGTWGTGEGRKIEIFSRTTGKRLARHSADDASLRTRGDVLVIAAGDRDDPTEKVVTPD